MPCFAKEAWWVVWAGANLGAISKGALLHFECRAAVRSKVEGGRCRAIARRRPRVCTAESLSFLGQLSLFLSTGLFLFATASNLPSADGRVSSTHSWADRDRPGAVLFQGNTTVASAWMLPTDRGEAVVPPLGRRKELVPCPPPRMLHHRNALHIRAIVVAGRPFVVNSAVAAAAGAAAVAGSATSSNAATRAIRQ